MKNAATLFCMLGIFFGAGCTNMTPAEQSILSGSTLGAIGGAAIGSLSGQAEEGALIGAGIGAVAGAMQENNRQAQQPQRIVRVAPYDEYDDEEYEITEYYYE